MIPAETLSKLDKKTTGASIELQRGIDNHKKAAKHHEAAAKYHYEAAKYHEEGDHNKASESTIKAFGHHYLASDHQREDVKHHALNS